MSSNGSIIPKFEIEDKDYENLEKIDKANRQDALMFIKNIVNNVSAPYVLAINGPWGTGKTVFLKMLKKKITHEHRTVYYSAWEHDYSSDPLLSLLTSLKKEFKSVSKFNELMESAGRVVLGTMPQITGLLSAGLVPSEVSRGVITQLAKSIGLEASKNKDAVDVLKNKLTTFVRSEPGHKKLVIIIDDLDRCKPTYAVELLEKIKHVFNIERVVFILAIDRKQLENSIKAVYGYRYDAKKYLIRFFDSEFNLPHTISNDYLVDIIKKLGLYSFFESRYTNLQTIPTQEHPNNQIKTVINNLHNLFNFDLREVQRILHRFALISLTANSADDVEPIIMLTLLIFHQYDKDLYNFIVSEENFDLNRMKKFEEISKKTRSKKDKEYYGIIAGLTVANKKYTEVDLADLFSKRSNDPFSWAAIESIRCSSNYIKRTHHFIMGSNEFLQ